MERIMKQFKAQRMGLVVGACGVFLTAFVGQSGIAQNARDVTETISVAGTDTRSKSLEPVAFSTLMPGASASATKAAGGEEEESSNPEKPGTTGIRIHGHWVLQVKNANGTTGERREFNNSLVTTYSSYMGQTVTNSGSTMVALALSGNIAMGEPGVGLVQGTLSGDPSTWCAQNLASVAVAGISCYVLTSTNSLWNVGANRLSLNGTGQVYTQLGLTSSASYTPTANMVMTGNFTVPNGLTQITAVQSLFGGCSGSGEPGNANLSPPTFNGTGSVRNADLSAQGCTATYMYGTQQFEDPILGILTSTPVTNSNGVATPLAVTQGQVVTVTVTLTFS